MLAAPMTYQIKGIQYIAIGTGWGGGGWPYVPRYSAAYRYGNANRIFSFSVWMAARCGYPIRYRRCRSLRLRPAQATGGQREHDRSRTRSFSLRNCAILPLQSAAIDQPGPAPSWMREFHQVFQRHCAWRSACAVRYAALETICCRRRMRTPFMLTSSMNKQKTSRAGKSKLQRQGKTAGCAGHHDHVELLTLC